MMVIIIINQQNQRVTWNFRAHSATTITTTILYYYISPVHLPKIAAMPRPLRLPSLRAALPRPHSPLLLRRLASTAPPPPRRHYLSTTLLLGGGVLFLAYYYDSKSLLHEHVAMPLMRLVADPEEGHKLAVRVLAWDKWARPRDMGVDGDELQAEVTLLERPCRAQADMLYSFSAWL